MKKIFEYCKDNSNAKLYDTLGKQNYLSCINYVDGVVGNSSSGLTEVPSFKKGTVNIGDRQNGRLKASSVIDCEPNSHSILAAIRELYSKKFQSKLCETNNPYGNGGSTASILKVLENHSLDNIIKKQFFDLVSK